MAGGFLMGLGQGLGNVNQSLSQWVQQQNVEKERARQAEQDRLNKPMQLAQASLAQYNATNAPIAGGYSNRIQSAKADEGEADANFTKWLDGKMGPTVSGVGAKAPGQEVPIDGQDPMQRMALGRHGVNVNEVYGPMTGSKPPLATVQRGLSAIDSTIRLSNDLLKLTESHNPSDPNGEHTGWMHLLGDKVKAVGQNALYNMGFPVGKGLTADDEAYNQLASLGDIVGAIPYMQGSRNFMMYQEAMKHLGSATATPEATHQRMQRVIATLPGLREDMLNAGKPLNQQREFLPAPGAPTIPPQAAPVAAPPQTPPQQAPTAPPSIPISRTPAEASANMTPIAQAAAAAPPTGGSSMSRDRVARFAASKNIPFDQAVKDITARGITITP